MTNIKDKPISDKHQAFIDEYLVNGRNATKAYQKAYPDNKTPEFSGSRLLSNVKIKQVIGDNIAKSRQKAELTIQSVLKNLAWGIKQAIVKKDLRALARLSELQGKYLSMWSDAGANSADIPEPISAKAIAKLRPLALAVNMADLEPKTIKIHGA